MLTYLIVFLVGGFICAMGQLLIIKTNITSARILVSFVLVGVFAGALPLWGSAPYPAGTPSRTLPRTFL